MIAGSGPTIRDLRREDRQRRAPGVPMLHRWLALAAWPALLVPGCSPAPAHPAGEDTPALEALQAMAPEQVRIHPLSRIEVDHEGKWRVVCHIELIDRYGQTGKWPMHLSLSTASPGSAANFYEFDLTDPARNAAAFDWISRCYVLLLAQPVPPGTEPAIGTGSEPPPSRVSVDAVARILLPDGQNRELTGRFEIVGGR